MGYMVSVRVVIGIRSMFMISPEVVCRNGGSQMIAIGASVRFVRHSQQDSLRIRG